MQLRPLFFETSRVKRSAQMGSSMELRLGFEVRNVLLALLCNTMAKNQEASSVKWSKLKDY